MQPNLTNDDTFVNQETATRKDQRLIFSAITSSLNGAKTLPLSATSVLLIKLLCFPVFWATNIGNVAFNLNLGILFENISSKYTWRTERNSVIHYDLRPLRFVISAYINGSMALKYLCEKF